LFLIEVEVTALNNVFGEILKGLFNGSYFLEGHSLVECLHFFLDVFNSSHPFVVVFD